MRVFRPRPNKQTGRPKLSLERRLFSAGTSAFIATETDDRTIPTADSNDCPSADKAVIDGTCPRKITVAYERNNRDDDNITINNFFFFYVHMNRN